MPDISTIHFTIDALARLPLPDRGAATYKDKQNSALSLYVTAAGSKTFFFRKRIRGRDRRVRIGGFPALTIAQARIKATTLAAEVELGLDPAEEKQKQHAARLVTLEDRYRDYIEQHCKRRNKRWQDQEKEACQYLAPLARRPFGEITRHDVERLHAMIGKKAPVKANRVVALLRSVYNYQIKKGWQGTNPAKGVEFFREVSRDRFVLPEEMPFLLAAIDAEHSLNRDFFRLLLLTGARKSNMQRMRWEQIDWHLRHWRIPETKNGQAVTLPLVEHAVSVLNEHQKNKKTAWVFPQRGNTGKPYSNPQKAWNRIKARATLLLWKREEALAGLIEKVQQKRTQPCGEEELLKKVMQRARDSLMDVPPSLMDLRIHDLRRTCGSYQAISGASLQVIGQSLGHKSIQATQIYARLNLDPIRQSMEKAAQTMIGGTFS